MTATLTIATDVVSRARAHYGVAGPALMARLKADSYTGRTLAERAAQWAQSQEADASAAALDTALSSVDADTDGTDTDLETVAASLTASTGRTWVVESDDVVSHTTPEGWVCEVQTDRVMTDSVSVYHPERDRAGDTAVSRCVSVDVSDIPTVVRVVSDLLAGISTGTQTVASDTDLEPTPHGWETVAPVEPIQPEGEYLPATQTGYKCAVCRTDIGWDAPNGVCSVDCLNRRQGFVPAAPVTLVVPVLRPTVPTPPSGGSGKATDLMDAHRQWADRPADERYWTVADALEATQHHRETARELVFPWKDTALATADNGRDIVLCLPDGTEATLTNYSAHQLCQDVGAPHAYLSKLPTELAVSCLEHGLVKQFSGLNRKGEPKSANALIHQNGYTKLRSLTSDKYARFWNAEVFQALLPLTEQGWVTPPARPSHVNDPRSRRATPEDVLTRRDAKGGLVVNVGDWISPAGIYASDHDMFAFLVNEDMRLDDGTPDRLARGFFVSNSEVGAGALKLKAFYYRQVCGNHIVWGAEHVVEVNVRHVGTFDSIRQKFNVQVKGALDSFTSASLAEDQATIDRARSFMLTTASDPEKARKEVLDALIRGVSENRSLKPASGISQKMFVEALDYAEKFADVDHVHPYSLWGAVNGLTRYSQSAGVGLDFADERARVDALTGKLMKLVGAVAV